MASKVVKAKAAEVKTAAKTVEVKETAKAAETTAKAEAVVEKADEKKVEEKPAKKAPAKRAAKAPAKKATKEEAKTEIVLQFDAVEVSAAAIEEKVKAQFVAEGHRAGCIKSLNIYVKPAEYKAYYVINDKFDGFVWLP